MLLELAIGNGRRNYLMTKSLRKICGQTEDQSYGEIIDNPDNELAEDRILLLLIFKLFSILTEIRKCHINRS